MCIFRVSRGSLVTAAHSDIIASHTFDVIVEFVDCVTNVEIGLLVHFSL